MNATLPATTRAKLAKLLGLLGSDHPGERDAAGLAAHRLVVQAGLSWQQVIKPPPVEKSIPELGTWRQTCRLIIEEHAGSLRPWELGFIRDLPGFQRLSRKQRYILKEIADRVLQRGTSI